MTLIDDCRANAHKVVDGDLAVFMAQNGNRMIVDTKRDGERCWLYKGPFAINGFQLKDTIFAFNRHKSVYFEDTHKELFDQYRSFGINFLIEGELCSSTGQLYSYLSSRNNGHDLVYYPYDLLELNGMNLRDTVLEYRLNVLCGCLAHIGMNNMNYYDQDSTEVDIKNRVKSLIDEGYEGAVIKPPLRKYNEGTWLRYKRQFTLDAVILGVTKSNKYLLDNLARSFRLGLYNNGVKPGGIDYKWVGDVGSGLELYEKAALTELLEASRIDEDRDYIYTEPRFVLEIVCDSKSEDNHLISPRIKRIRTDKSPEQCLFSQMDILPLRN
jgi:ATP-dependent DNA ligase